MLSHQVVHDTLAASAPYVGAVIALAVFVAAAGLACSYFRRMSAGARHHVLSVAVIAPLLAALFVAAGAGSLLRPRVAVPPTGDRTGETSIAPIAAPSEVFRDGGAPLEVFCALALLWIAGVTAFSAVSFRAWWRWKRVAAGNSAEPSDALLARFRAAPGAMPRPPRLAVSGSVAEPMVVGLLRPVLLLPRSSERSLSPEEIDAVFAHELAHVRRWDNLTAAVHEMVCALFWFDPLHWLARRRLLDLREQACDERVLERGYGVDDYLTVLAKSSHAAVEAPAIACMSGFHIRERMEWIMSYASHRSRLIRDVPVRAITLVAALAATVLFAAAAPQPSVASPAPPVRSFDVAIHPMGDGRVLIDVAVIGVGGEILMSPRVSAVAGQPVHVSAEAGGRKYQVEVDPRSGVAVLEVLEGAALVHRVSRDLAPLQPSSLVPDAPPISLQLEDANLHDVLRTFSQLTGHPISADPSLHGKVTIEVTNVPWDVALARSLRPLGLRLEQRGGEIVVVRDEPAPGEQTLDGYLRMGRGIKPPIVLSRVEPQYSEEARAARIAGVVILETFIDEQGVVRDVRILKRLPFGLDQAAADAVRRWVFAPAVRDGKPVPVVYNVTVNFRSDDPPAAAR